MYVYCSSQGANNMTVELLDSTENKDIYIIQALIDANIAKRSPPRIKEPFKRHVQLSPYMPG